jgi:RNA polymerase sigma-70 factor (ECF subfamily)
MGDLRGIDRATLNSLYRYCFSLTNNEAVAFDLLQDGLEAFLRRAPKDLDSPIPYLRRLLRNRFIDQVRRSKRFPEQSLDPDDEYLLNNTLGIGLQVLENESIASRDLEIIWELLNSDEREILYLWALQGMTAAEIAVQIEVPRNSVLSRIHRLRQKIRRHLGDPTTQHEAGKETGQP